MNTILNPDGPQFAREDLCLRTMPLVWSTNLIVLPTELVKGVERYVTLARLFQVQMKTTARRTYVPHVVSTLR